MQFLSKMLGFWGGGMIGGGTMGPNFMLIVNDLHILASSLSFMRERLSSFNASDWNKVFLINIFNRWFQHNPRSFQGSNPAYDFLPKLQDGVNVKHNNNNNYYWLLLFCQIFCWPIEFITGNEADNVCVCERERRV